MLSCSRLVYGKRTRNPRRLLPFSRGRFMTRWRFATWLSIGLLLCGPALAEYSGRRVSDVLDELRASGLTFIYNTQIVPPDLLVREEPRAGGGLALAREILAGVGLDIAAVAPGVYAVVRGAARDAAPGPPPAESRPQPMEEVVVQTSRYSLASESVVSQTFLTQEQVNSLPRLGDETLRAVQRLPGTSTNGFSSIGSVRGGEPNEVAVVLDGLRLYEPFHLKNFLSPVSLLDSRVIDGLEFYSGGFPAIHGDRMSAIIEATTVRPEMSPYYELGLSLFHAGGLASTDFDQERGRALLAARRSNVGDLAHYAENDFGEPQYTDAFARLEYEWSDRTRASLDLLTSNDKVRALQAGGTQSAMAKYRNGYAWGTLDHDWSERLASRLIVSYTDLLNQRDGEVNDPGRRIGSVHDERRFHVVGLRLENTFVTDRLVQRFGFEGRRLWGKYHYNSVLDTQADYPFPGSPPSFEERTLEPRPDGFEASGYWEARANLGDSWTLQGGVRIDTQTYDGSDDGEQWSPRLSVLYQAGRDTQLRASWGRYFQSQAINELQVEDGIARFHGAQYADHAIVSLDHALLEGLDLRVEAYHKNYRRVSPRFENLFDPLSLFPEAEFDRVMIDADESEAAGVEVLLRLQPHGAWSGWLGYTWSRVRDHVAGRDVPRSWDQPHALSIGVAWASGPWTVTFANNYHTGWPTTALAIVDEGGVPQLVTENRNRERFEYYNTLDLRATRTFALPRGALDVFIEVSNAMDRTNPCCVEYEVREAADGSTVIARDVDPWLPLVPSAGVLWRFGPARDGR
jgi:outer membrane receptor protein involved in Fe transport